MPGEDIYSWSTTAASNDTADTSINWREGMARAAVNDSSRSSMAAVAKFRDLLKGTIVTSGTADAQTFVTPTGYTTIPTGLRALLKIGPTLTNTGATTLSMDGIASSPVKNKAGADLIGGELVAGGYVEVIYDGTNWILVADGKEKVNRSGDTMTGALTVNSDITATGDLISNSGNALLNGVNPQLTFNDTGTAIWGIQSTADTLTIGPADIDGNILTNRFLLGPDGTFGIVGVNPQLTFFDVGTAIWGIQSTANQITMGTADTNGNITANYLLLGETGLTIPVGGAAKPGGGSWSDSSDARIKNVVGNYSSGLDAVKQLHPVRYTFKGNDAAHRAVAESGKEFVGVVAQDVEQYLPELVTQVSGNIDGVAVNDLRMLDTTPLIYALVNSIKELLVRIEALEAKVP